MSDPGSGETEITPETGESEITPKLDLDTLNAQHQKDLKKVHGKGRITGRDEGRLDILSRLGLDDEADLDDVAARLTGPPPEDSAREIGLLNRKVSEYERSIEISKARSDRYRQSELKAAALGAGVRPTMVDDFSLVYSRNIRWDEADLAVYDGDTPTGEDLTEYVSRILKDKPDWQAPRGMEGAGEIDASKVAPTRKTSMRNDHLSTRERIMKRDE